MLVMLILFTYLFYNSMSRKASPWLGLDGFKLL